MSEIAAEQNLVKWGPLRVIAATLFIFFGAQVLVVAGVYAYFLIQGQSVGYVDNWLIAGNNSQFVLSLLVGTVSLVLVGLYLKLRRAKWADIGWRRPKISDVGLALIGFVAYFAAYLVVVSAVSAIYPELNTEQSQDLGFDTSTTGLTLLVIFVSLVIIPPIMEEVITRGVLFTGLRQKLKFLPAAIVASAIFGLAHLPGGEGGTAIWIAVIDTFVLGMVLAYLRERTGRLWAPIFLHALKNGIAFTLLFVIKIS